MSDKTEQLARAFHDAYEHLAPQFGYETRQDTKHFDPASANGKLMMAVCDKVFQPCIDAAVAAEREACAEVAYKERANAQKEITELMNDGLRSQSAEDIWTGRLVAAQEVLAAIRARGSTDALAALNEALKGEE